jgi:hypothetical protein
MTRSSRYAHRRTRGHATGRATRGSHALCLLALLVSGCGFSIQENLNPFPINQGNPPNSYALDVEASSVEYVGNDGPSVMDAVEVRAVMAQVLRARVVPRRDGQTPPPARFRLLLNVQREVWPGSWFALCIDLQVLGCPTGHAAVSSQLEIQVGNEFYVGNGYGSGYGGLYYNGFNGVPKAVALAIQSAVSTLSPAMPVGQ